MSHVFTYGKDHTLMSESTTSQLEQMMSELQSSQIATQMSHSMPVSFDIPLTPQPEPTQTKRSNPQLVRSVLYMSYLIRNGKNQRSSNDFLVDSLETVTSVMDNLYLVTKFGIGKNSKFLQSVTRNASKVWFVTLLFTIKNLIGRIIGLMRLKNNILRELIKCQNTDSNVELSRIIINKYELKIEEIKQEIVGESLELFGSFNDLLLVCIEIFGWKVSPKIEKFVGMVSAFASIYRMSRRSSSDDSGTIV